MDKINKKFVSESSSFTMESSYFEYEDHFRNKENEMRTMCDKLYKHIEDRYTFIIDIIDKLENGIYKNREDFRKDFDIVEYDDWNRCGKFDVFDDRDYNNLWNSISYSTQLWDNPVTKARQDAYNKKWEEYLSLKKSVDEDKKKELYQDMKTLHIQCLNYYLADEKFIYSALSEIEKLEDRVKENLFDKFTERLETSSIGEQLKQLDIYDWDEESLKALLSKRFIRDFNIVIDNGKKACEWPIECIKQYIEYTENLIKN